MAEKIRLARAEDVAELNSRIGNFRMKRYVVPAKGVFRFAYDSGSSGGVAMIATGHQLPPGRTFHIVYPGGNSGQPVSIETIKEATGIAITTAWDTANARHVVEIKNTVNHGGTYYGAPVDIITTGSGIVVL